MKYWKMSVLLVAILIFFIFKSTAYAGEPSHEVCISELFWSGSFVSSADEFIELKNNTASNINLTGWEITKLNSEGAEELMLVINFGIIPSGGYFLIGNSAKDHQFSNGESVLDIEPDQVDSDVALSNDRLQIKLYDGDWQDGRAPTDIAGDGGAPLAGDNTSKSSLERTELCGDGTLSENWLTAGARLNLDEYSQEFAAPRNSGRPKIISLSASVQKIFIGKENGQITFYAEVSDPDGLEDVENIEIDLTTIGFNEYQLMHDDGINWDETAGDGIFTFRLDNIGEASVGEKNLQAAVKDKKGLENRKNITIQIYQLSDDIVINEVLPRPSDDSQNEFIELYNSSESNVDLYGWQIDDMENSGSSPYNILENIVISSNGFSVFYKSITKIALNDGGDAVRLIDPEGKTVSFLSGYGKAIKGCSYNKTNGGWSWSSISTPGAENIILKPPEDSNGFPLNLDKIIETRSIPVGTEITVVGDVINLPGNFASQYFYIQDETAGIQVYCYKKDFPNLNIGDKIRVNGELTHNSSGYRIKIDNRDNIEVLEKNHVILPKYLKTGSANNEFEGMFVKVRGKVIKSSGTTFYLDDGTGVIKIVVKKATGIKKPKIKKGMIIEISGIVVPYKDGYQIAPRFDPDIKVIAGAAVKEKSALINEIIKPAYAASYSDNIFQDGKAAEVNSGEFESKSVLINILKIIIIISSALFIYLIGDKYVGAITQQAKIVPKSR